MKFNPSFLAKMLQSRQTLQSEGPAAATAAIQRALNEVGGAPNWSPAPQAPTHVDIEVVTREAPAPKRGFLDRFLRDRSEHAKPSPRPVERPDVSRPGRFLSGSFSNAAGTRAYKLYVPASYAGEPLPLIVMLHGCTQNPDDFAAGTGMNAVAEENGCLVLYPAQTKRANGSNCWNWFRTEDQGREGGEPAIIAGMTREVMAGYRVDASRVYVAGLSAGGAMAAVMGATHPELYAAVGIHSGLPHGAAHDVPSAFGAMKNGQRMKAPHAGPKPLARDIPVIVFHGDGDTTVHPVNGDQALAQCVPAALSGARREVEKGRSGHGRLYTRTLLRGEDGAVVAEHWVVHGAGHAWAGGSSDGSYTDPEGPQASREMVRFFLGLKRRA